MGDKVFKLVRENFSKLIMVGILICLIVIAIKPTNIQVEGQQPYIQVPVSNPNVNIDQGEQVIQLAPNRIAIIDSRVVSDTRGNIVVFDYDSNTKKFIYAGTMNYLEVIKNPSVFEEPKK